MATNRDHERLTNENMKRVILALETEKPITKKAACEILNISYNTTRLKKLIDEFKDKQETIKIQRRKKRGTPLTDSELSMIAQGYLNGEALSSLSEFLYRPANKIKEAIYSLGIPEKSSEDSYHNPPLLPEQAVVQDYEPDDLVYSGRYQSAALIEKRWETQDGPIYTIYVLGNEQCYASQPWWELCDLRRVQNELGVKITAQTGMEPSYNPPNKG